MIVYCMLSITVLIFLLAVYTAWQAGCGSISSAFDRILLSVSLMIFIYLYGTWVFISVYTKYVLGIVFIIVFIASLARKKTSNMPGRPAGKKIWNSFISIILLLLSVLYFTGTAGEPYGIVNIPLPFKQGTYFVFQGGKGLPTNFFHYKYQGAVYAMDIIKLNSTGARAGHIFSTQLNDYAIFGDTVYSPCNGRVVSARGNNKDNEPPLRIRGVKKINHVLIAADSFYVFLGHLKQNNVFVRAGDSVVKGQPVGCAGNSGYSIEPHLHIQVHARTNPRLPWYMEKPMLIKFNGRSYLLFQTIKAG